MRKGWLQAAVLALVAVVAGVFAPTASAAWTDDGSKPFKLEGHAKVWTVTNPDIKGDDHGTVIKLPGGDDGVERHFQSVNSDGNPSNHGILPDDLGTRMSTDFYLKDGCDPFSQPLVLRLRLADAETGVVHGRARAATLFACVIAHWAHVDYGDDVHRWFLQGDSTPYTWDEARTILNAENKVVVGLSIRNETNEGRIAFLDNVQLGNRTFTDHL